MPDDARFDLGDGPFTIEFWAKRSGTGSGYLLNKGNGGYGVFFAGSDNKLHFEKVNTQATAQESGTTDQAWHHWAIVQGAGTANAIIYKDGVNSTTPNNQSTFVERRRRSRSAARSARRRSSAASTRSRSTTRR